ncbi:unnamed protein product [Coregonus sp. 'balchen']|nr:unnamed protein product [Coregonus sp. 'balchen']
MDTLLQEHQELLDSSDVHGEASPPPLNCLIRLGYQTENVFKKRYFNLFACVHNRQLRFALADVRLTEPEVLNVPMEERRQESEPKRLLMDLSKEHISEMDRRVTQVSLSLSLSRPLFDSLSLILSSPLYTPSVDEYRQGTENSQKTLVDIKPAASQSQLSGVRTDLSQLHYALGDVKDIQISPADISKDWKQSINIIES